MLKSGIWIPTKLIFDCSKGNNLTSLAYFCKLRMIFRRPIIYNFTFTKASDILGVSKSTAHTIFKRLEALNLVRYVDGHCILLTNVEAKNKYHDKRGRTSFTCIKKLKSIDDIKTWIQYQRLTISAKGQKGQINKKAHSFLMHNARSKNVSKESLEFNTDIILSNKTIGGYFCMSLLSGHRIQKKLNDLGLMKSIPNYKKTEYGRMSSSMFRFMGLDSRYFLHKGEVFKRCANTVSLIDCTV